VEGGIESKSHGGNAEGLAEDPVVDESSVHISGGLRNALKTDRAGE
jgi:hypothetical protein